MNDSYLISGKDKLSSIAPELKEKLEELSQNAPPVPESGESKVEERGSVITGLETGAFDDGEGDGADIDVPLPSRLLSGWVAARIISEGSRRTIQTGGVPLIGKPIITDPSAPSAISLLGGYPAYDYAASATSNSSSFFSSPLLASAAHSRHFGYPRHRAALPTSQATMLGSGGVGGTGSSVGLGALRLDLSLSDRIAAIQAKSEERSKRFLLLRRHYLQSLKNYHLEAREQDIAIEQLRTATVEARVKVRGPERSTKFATDQEEWAAVDRMSMSSSAVYFQNLELRTRLAALTNRSSGCDAEELSSLSNNQMVKKADKGDASSASNNALSQKEIGVKVLTRNGNAVSGGAKAKTKKGEKATTAANSKTKAKTSKVDDDDEVMRDDNDLYVENNDDDDDDENDPYMTRARTEPRRGPRHVKNASETVLGVGDLVLSAYGRGIVVRQRDPDSSASFCITQVLLEWGANAFVSSKSLTLLCVAGEEYLGDRSLDASLLQQCGVSKITKSSSALSASIPQVYNADDLIMEASALSRKQSQAGSQVVPSTSLSTSAPSVAVPTTKQGIQSEQDDDNASMKDAASTPPGRGNTRSRRKSVSQVSPQKNRSFRTAATDAADEEEGEDEKEAAKRALKKLKTKSGKPMSMRAPVFVTSWDAYGVPRGVPLRLDPARNATLGFVVAVNEFPSSSKFGSREGVSSRTISGTNANQVAALEPFADEISPRSSSSSSSSAATRGAGAAASENSLKNELKSENNSQSRYFGPGSPLHGVTSGDALNASAADIVRQLRAQNERLTFQLRHSEEIREEQRSRLSDTKDSISRILEQLNSERETSREIAEELRVCMLEANEVTSRLVALAKRFDPASPTAQVVLPTIPSTSSTSFASLVLGSTPLTSGTAESFVISETSRKRKAGDAPSSASRHTQTIRTHPPQSSADSDSDGVDDDAEAHSSAPAEKHRPQTRSGRNGSASLSLGGTHGRRGGVHARASEESAETAAAEAAADTDDYDVMDSDDAEEETEKGNATMDDEDEAGDGGGGDESDDGLAALLELTSVRTRAQRSSQGHELASNGPSSSSSSSLAKGKKGSTRPPPVEAATSGDGAQRAGGKRRRTQDDFQEDGVSALHAIVADAMSSNDGALKTRSSNNGKDVPLKKSSSLSASSAPAHTQSAAGNQSGHGQTIADNVDDEVPTSKRASRTLRGSNNTGRAEEDEELAEEPKQQLQQNKRRR